MKFQVLSRLFRRLALPIIALSVALAIATCTARLLPRQEEAEQVFLSLSPQVQSELLAGAVALLTEEEEGYTLRLAVAGVLLNRLESGRYGNSLWEVTAPLLQDGRQLGGIPKRYDAHALTVAEDALSGLRPFPGALACGRGAKEGSVGIGDWWFAAE